MKLGPCRRLYLLETYVSTGLLTLSLCLQLWTSLPFRLWLQSTLITRVPRPHQLFLFGTVCQPLPAIWPEWPTMPCHPLLMGNRMGCRLISTATRAPSIPFLLPWWPPWNRKPTLPRPRMSQQRNRWLRKNRPAPEDHSFGFHPLSITAREIWRSSQLRYVFTASPDLTVGSATDCVPFSRWPVYSGSKKPPNCKPSKNTSIRLLRLSPRQFPPLDFRNGFLQFCLQLTALFAFDTRVELLQAVDEQQCE